MLVHRNPSLVYTADHDGYCGQAGLGECAQAVVTAPADPDSTVIFHVLAAFPGGSSPRLKGLTFGVEYDPERLILADFGACIGDLENGAFDLAGGGWPASATGTTIVFEYPRTGQLVTCYWFAAYANTVVDSTLFRVTAHPDTVLAGTFGDDSIPSLLDPIADYGRLGFGCAGSAPCPSLGNDQPEGAGDDEPSEGDGDLPEQEDGWDDDIEGGCTGVEHPTDKVSVYLLSNAVDFDPYETEPVAIESVEFLLPGLPERLREAGALTLRKEYPGSLLADTLGYDENGQPIRLPDISGYYELAFADSLAACAAVTALMQMEGIRLAQIVPHYDFVLQTPPNDDYYEDWNFLPADAQWHLDNDGLRGPDDRCGRAIAGYDIGAEVAWSAGVVDSSVVIADIDTGIMGGMAEYPDSTHEDLRVIPLTYAQRQLINKHPDQNLCLQHGTAMSGLAAARTNNDQGVAGVCPTCSMLDVEWSPCDEVQCANRDPNACGRVDGGWENALRNAMELAMPEGKRVKVTLLEFAQDGPQVHLNISSLALLWRLRSMYGVSMVAPSTDEFTSNPGTTIIPGNAPMVFGVGAHTWEGLAWDSLTSCYPTLDQGNGLGFSEWPWHARAGSVLELCAPGSGHLVTTQPYPLGCSPVETCRYYWTKGMCSGAAAITAGAVGHLQALYRQGTGTYLLPDDVEGILRSTARPFRIEPTDPRLRPSCPPSICPREFYGSGMLDLAGATQLVDSLLSGRVALDWSHVDHNQPEWTYVPVDSAEESEGPDRKMWIQYRASGQGRAMVSSDQFGLDGIPKYIAWARPFFSSSYPAYGTSIEDRKDLALAGVTDCRIGPVDQETGTFTITGYDFAWRYAEEDSAQDLHFLKGEDNLWLAYGRLRLGPGTAVPELSPEPNPVLTLRAIPSPISGPVAVGFTVFPEGEVSICAFDVSGRQVGRIFQGRVASGYHEAGWDLRDAAGLSLPHGIYWIRLQMGTSRVTKRMVVIGS